MHRPWRPCRSGHGDLNCLCLRRTRRSASLEIWQVRSCSPRPMGGSIRANRSGFMLANSRPSWWNHRARVKSGAIRFMARGLKEDTAFRDPLLIALGKSEPWLIASVPRREGGRRSIRCMMILVEHPPRSCHPMDSICLIFVYRSQVKCGPSSSRRLTSPRVLGAQRATCPDLVPLSQPDPGRNLFLPRPRVQAAA